MITKCSTHNIRFVTGLAILLVWLVATGAFAQLDSKAIADMQAQGEAEDWTFTVGENGATQYSLDQLCGLVEPDGWRDKAKFDPMEITTKQTIPTAFDWRDYDGCTPIRNQGGCGACWAFASVGPLECAIKIREGITTDLSEEWLLSCNESRWNCDGGWFAHSYHGWLTDACGGTGAVMEADFPYQARGLPCDCPYNHYYTLSNWAYIGSSSGMVSIEQMKLAILEYGPISVSVYVNSAFQGYNGGVFNSCTDGTINHAVVLVGWDDTQGENGVWFLRNSWGSWWGESGYMRIAYNCCQVGYAACYVDYRPVNVACDQDFGEAPLDVNFSVEVPGASVIDYQWNFGDGFGSTDPAPSHSYVDPGCYTVELVVTTDDGDLTRICPDFISAHADTLRGNTVEISEGGPVRMDIFARNTIPVSFISIPFNWTGSFGLTYDSLSNTGARTAYLGPPELIGYDPNNSRAAAMIDAGSQAPLASGEGLIATIWFTAPAGVQGVNPVVFESYAHFEPVFRQADREYQPNLVDGLFHTGLAQSCCVGRVGDVNMSGEDEPTIGDISFLIDHLFVGGISLECLDEADINQSGGTWPTESDLSIGDVSALIDYLFINGTPIPDCF